MKRLLILFSISIVFCLASCTKGLSGEHDIEGAWGLIYAESYELDGEKIVRQERTNFEKPLNPKYDFDVIFVFQKDTGNQYSNTIYAWDNDSKEWQIMSSSMVTASGNTIYWGDEAGCPFSIFSDILVMEYTEKAAHRKYVFRKMSEHWIPS